MLVGRATNADDEGQPPTGRVREAEKSNQTITYLARDWWPRIQRQESPEMDAKGRGRATVW